MAEIKRHQARRVAQRAVGSALDDDRGQPGNDAGDQHGKDQPGIGAPHRDARQRPLCQKAR